MTLKEGSHVVILGAGISGLSLGWFLKKKFGSKIKLSIMEKAERPGGWLATDHAQGFLFEKGPRSFRTKGAGAATLRLLRSLGLQEQVITGSPKAKDRYLLLDKRLQRVSLNPFSFIIRNALPGLLNDLFQAKGDKNDESIGAFFRRRTSAFVTNTLIDPMAAGIYAGDIDRLSMRSCFPKLWEWEQSRGSLLMGMLRSKRRQEKDPWIQSLQKHPLFSLKEGVEALPKALAHELKGHLWLNSPVTSLNLESDGRFQVSAPAMTLAADALFSTLPSYALANLVKSPYLADLLRCIPYASVAVVNLGFRRKVLHLQGFGYLVPSNANEQVLGVVWDSSIFPEQNTHENETRLTVMIGGARHPEILQLSQEHLVKIALSAIRRHMDILWEPDAVQVTLAKEAIPQYRVGHHLLLDAIEKAEADYSPRLRILGSSLYGVAVNDSIAMAEEVAQSLSYKG
jgi:oxygen-dependent protoporphyrinogen oxidase